MSYRRRLGSLLLYLRYVFRALINSLVCWFCTSALGLVLFQICHFLQCANSPFSSWLFFIIIYYYWSLLYSAILRSRADSLRSHVILEERIAYYSAFFEYPPKCTYSAGMAGATRICSQSRRVLCTPYNHAPCHFMQSHIRKVYACLAVTCHLRLWQNDRGLLRATAVTRGWNGYRNKSQHRKLTLEKRVFLAENSQKLIFSLR